MDFWDSKRVLITGHTGFKGGWLSLWLQSRGANVVGYALNPPTNPSLFEVARVAEGMTSIIGDVRELDHLQTVMREHRPQVVFHLAAQALIKDSYSNPIETYSTNVLGTANVLEAARHTESVRSIISITSDKCYKNKGWPWGYRETDELGGYDPYSSSKGCAELVVASYRRSFFSGGQAERPVAVASTRAGNVIGGGDWAPNRLVPDVVTSFEAGRPVHIRSPKATRPWQHVVIPLHGYLTLAEHLWVDGDAFASGWNFGPDEEDAKPVLWMANRMKQLWGDGASVEFDTTAHPHEDTYLKLDSSKARTRLPWSPGITVAQGLQWTVDWYRRYYQDPTDMRAFTLAQIAEYEGMINTPQSSSLSAAGAATPA